MLMSEHSTINSPAEIAQRQQQLQALVEGKLEQAKDAAALNTALRSLLAAATVDWAEDCGIRMEFALVGHGPGLRGFAIGGEPERIRDASY